ncbi:cytochrome c3 family protein [Aromatoleum toluclasticum]|uniref:cytochrome c3 family protein n=1 Tax=Aromatoleum toluclasticum TaxID=92003 RepID=UPI001D18F569|nr:cytochrome c3 family protein [Aromatoleum toluclasticum]MCC4114257.1 cytochrome c3 family protein [Aromatoleum toluclasticum]
MENYSRPATGFRHILTLVACMLSLAGSVAPAEAQQSKISNTKHNLSSSGSGTVKATTESQICVFCHTPHAANTAAPAPLWNRTLSSATYTPYTSNSLDAQTIFGALSQPGGSSKLCLSCHDGTMAIGTVGVLGGKSNVSVTMGGTDAGGTMPAGPQGATSGFTRNLGIDLRNDHPISFTYNETLANADGELRHMDAQQRSPAGSGTVIGIRSAGYKPLLPLQPTGTAGAGQVQCTTCHDPHLDVPKFLRLNRLQTVNPAGGPFLPASDQICLGCHDKLGTAWAQSSHASQTIADETYKTDAANRREFLLGGKTSIQVWEAGCLNCHDTHAVQGSRRLLREGVLGGTGGTGAGAYKLGGDSGAAPNSVSAIEETCYQCHTTAAESILNTATGTVPNIKDDFTTVGNKHMPITTIEQDSGVETHDIKDSNFTEARETLGLNNNANRHAECTDCHNPHRVTRNNLFTTLGDPAKRTHVPGGANGAPSTTSNGNIASGALRGAFGVEPVYSDQSFFQLPNRYDEKRGDGGTGAATTVGSTWVTREYQICLKCHSDYGYYDDNVLPSGNSRPFLGAPGTPSPRANFDRYTNQAREFQAPAGHKGAQTLLGTAAGAGANFNDNNHRSWHPVMDVTGRGTAQRNNASANSWNAPWSANVGNQTMYCTDCHGSNTAAGSITPTGPWGPHGSINDFILKGTWDTSSGSGQANTICLKCHSSVYADGGGTTGFRGGGKGDLHAYHRDKVGRMRCNWCHIAVPHGWKNKSLLVNLNDTGPEVGLPAGTEQPNGAYTNGPYYRNAILKIVNFRSNADWSVSDCGSRSNTNDRGKEWMITSTCNSPP